MIIGGDASFANATFLSAASGSEPNGRPATSAFRADENRAPSPSKASPAKPTLKHQPSILAGLGFGRVVSNGSSNGKRDASGSSQATVAAPPSPAKAKVQFADGAFAGYDPEREPIKVRCEPQCLEASLTEPCG